MKHADLLSRAEDAIDRLTGDISVSPQTTLDSLETLQTHISVRMDAIREDLKNED